MIFKHVNNALINIFVIIQLFVVALKQDCSDNQELV